MTTDNDDQRFNEETGSDRRREVLADNALSVELVSAFSGDRPLTEAEKDYLTELEKGLHIVLDNLSAHKTKEVTEWVANRPRFDFHFTPTSASWLNAVEGWFAQLERRALYRGVFTGVADLKAELQRFILVHNRDLAKPFKWTKSADTILASLQRAENALPN